MINHHINLNGLSLSVGWTNCTAQTSILQDSGSEDLKTVATSRPLHLLDLPIQTFGISSSVAMGEVVENGVPVLLNCQGEGHKSIKDFWGDLVQPGEIALEGFLFGCGFIDAVKSFLEPIGGFQLGKVFQPSFKNQRLALIQIMRAFEQQEAIMHHGSSLLVGEALANVFTDSFQAPREQFEHVKLVYDQFDMWQDLMDCIMVASPHIRTHNGNMLFCAIGQALQVVDDRRLVPISEQINDLMVLNISDDAAVLVEQVQFINPDTCAVDGAGLCVFVGFLKDAANGSFIQSRIIGDAGKCPFERLLSNVEDQAFGHQVVFVHVVERFEERFATGSALRAPSDDVDGYALPSDGDVHEYLRSGSVSIQQGAGAMRATRNNRLLFGGNVVVVCVLFDGQDMPVVPPQNVQGLSPMVQILESFFWRRVIPVKDGGRLRFYSTHFAVFRVIRPVEVFYTLCRIAL